MRATAAASLLLLCSGCPITELIGGGDGLPVADIAALGSDVLTDVSNGKIEIDPTKRDALTALGGCADLISYCYQPPGMNVAACMALARTCESDQPWGEKYACCPQACKDAFKSAVGSGMSGKDALEQTLFVKPDCFPGVNALIGAP
jgi:hypothetical protein